jgi:imidazoleglycerol phosphate synthase glutamine amidotransferase subunit HisH
LQCEDNNEYFFNNCYGVISGPLKKEISTLFHHGKFIVMIQSKNILGYQFHPELSGKAQLGLQKQMRSWFYES